MSSGLFWMIIGAALWLLGLHGLLTLHQALRRIIAFNLMGSGVFLVMIALATRSQPSDPLLMVLRDLFRDRSRAEALYPGLLLARRLALGLRGLPVDPDQQPHG